MAAWQMLVAPKSYAPLYWRPNVTSFDGMVTTFPRIETPRLVLRQIQPADAEALFAPFSWQQFWQQSRRLERD